MHPSVHSSNIIFIVADTWKQPKCPLTNEQMKKMWQVYLYTVKYYLAIKKNETVSFAARHRPKDYHAKRSKSEKDKYHITHMWNDT